MKEYIVKQKQSKQVIMVLLAVLMVVVSVFCFVEGLKRGNLRYMAAGVAGTLFFGLCLCFITVRLIRPKALLIINGDGVCDQSSAISAGFVSWDEISGFGITSLLGQTFIGIDVTDRDSYLAKLPPLKKKAVQANIDLGYPPISITLKTADRSVGEALEAMHFYRNAYLERLRTNLTI